MRALAITGLILYLTAALAAQPDTSLLRLDRLTEADLRTATQRSDASKRLFSTDRTAQDVRDAPRTTYVITREEIIENGYVTLVDALKMVPGIRVSQPGSALLGETFLMRGHLGNHYTKILINDVPIRSIFAPGLSIGTQLPIRQAQRIEVTFGSTTTLYGGDASAGVINIILNDSERPTYTQSALTFNALEGFSGVNVQFGGKLGSGDKVFKFNVFGGNTLQTSRNVVNNYPDVYQYANYLQPGSTDSVYTTLENLEANVDAAGEPSPFIDDLPHQSRYLGGTLTYRQHQLSFLYAYRRDHTALGLHPLAVSYADPSTYVGENHFNLSYRHTGRRRRGRLTTGLLLNQFGALSSTRYVYPQLQRQLDAALTSFASPDPADPDAREQLRLLQRNRRSRYFSDRRYQFSGSAHLRLEYFYEIIQAEHAEWILGLQSTVTLGVPYNPYLRFAVDEDFTPYRISLTLSEIGTLLFDDTNRVLVVLPTQLNFNYEKWQVQLGAQFTVRGSELPLADAQVAGLYRLNDNWRVRATAGTATRQSSPFYNRLLLIDPSNVFDPIQPLPQTPDVERTATGELGLRFDKPLFQASASVFYQRTSGIPIYLDAPTAAGSADRLAGYYQRRGSFRRFAGLQGRLHWQRVVKRVDLVLGAQFGRGRLGVADFFDAGRTSTYDYLSGQPGTQLQARLTYRFWQRYHVQIDNLYASSFRTYQLGEVDNPAYYTLDLTTRVDLSRNFLLQLQVRNVFNQNYGGLDASGTADDLLFNPQVGRIVQFGASYRLD